MINKDLDQATYVVAVSGGVDSIVLLHILAHTPLAPRLVVAHFDHGIRDDSAMDRHFVAQLAEVYGLAFVFEEGYLGQKTSEDTARQARYSFLRRAKQAHKATHIITAHHEDDLLETAIINLLRGTGRKGLSSLRSHTDLYRPLLGIPKAHLVAYAKKHNLDWREDSTNSSTDYLRNYIRRYVTPKMDKATRERLRLYIAHASYTNDQIDALLREHLDIQPAQTQLDREWFVSLPHAVAKEIIVAWLRNLDVAAFDRRLVERIVVAAKTFAPGKRLDINGKVMMVVSHDRLTVLSRSGSQ